MHGMCSQEIELTSNAPWRPGRYPYYPGTWMKQIYVLYFTREHEEKDRYAVSYSTLLAVAPSTYDSSRMIVTQIYAIVLLNCWQDAQFRPTGSQCNVFERGHICAVLKVQYVLPALPTYLPTCYAVLGWGSVWYGVFYFCRCLFIRVRHRRKPYN